MLKTDVASSNGRMRIAVWDHGAPYAGAPLVLYVHGATFAATHSVSYPWQGLSWADRLKKDGFHVWSFDFLGYGASERYPEMSAEAEGEPLGRASVAHAQITDVVGFITQGATRRISLIAHSWGTLPSVHHAARHSETIEKLVLFGPIVPRGGPSAPALHSSRWYWVTVEDQLRRFTIDLPPDELARFDRASFDSWATSYLDSDRQARERHPPAVQVPYGPIADLRDAWAGVEVAPFWELAAPTLIVRGSWDTVTTEADVKNLYRRIPERRAKTLLTLPRGSHLAHLEAYREELFSAVGDFLRGRLPEARTRAI